MHRFVVLLRGVNVGKGNRLPMAKLLSMLGEQGYTEVRTLLNSGNAVFAAPSRSASAHAKKIAEALRKTLGISIPVVVKASSEFASIVAQNPITPPTADHSKFLVVFSQESSALKALTAVAMFVCAPERFVLGKRAAYLYCATGIRQSKAASALLGKLGRGVTTRSWATVIKLKESLDASAA